MPPFACIGKDQPEEKVKHRFSEPWEDSDVILVVENEKFHVHRLILSMNSPVFKAMLKSQFKEATANEIPLPEKKANELLNFLKKVYGFRYTQERVEITSKFICYFYSSKVLTLYKSRYTTPNARTQHAKPFLRSLS